MSNQITNNKPLTELTKSVKAFTKLSGKSERDTQEKQILTEELKSLELSGKQYYRKSCILILGNEEDKDNAKSFKQEVLTLKIVLTEHSDSEKKEDKNRIKSRLLIINLVRNNGRTKVKTKRAQRLKSTTN